MVSGSYHDFCGPTGNSGEASRNQGEKEESLTGTYAKIRGIRVKARMECASRGALPYYGAIAEWGRRPAVHTYR
jgi:hypothetical protein